MSLNLEFQNTRFWFTETKKQSQVSLVDATLQAVCRLKGTNGFGVLQLNNTPQKLTWPEIQAVHTTITERCISLNIKSDTGQDS